MEDKVNKKRYVRDASYQVADREIWNKFKNGSWEALEFIYRTYTKDLFNYGMKICGNSNLVEDSIQELFVELWNSRNSLTSPGNIKFYLLKSLRWKITHQLKRERKLYAAQVIEDVVEVSLPLENDLLSQQLSNERKQYLAEALGKLSKRQREVLQLLFYEQLSHQEVADLMDIRVRTVYVTAYRALSSLKEKLKPHAMKLLTHWALLLLLLS